MDFFIHAKNCFLKKELTNGILKLTNGNDKIKLKNRF
jgi:hypothetical protein